MRKIKNGKESRARAAVKFRRDVPLWARRFGAAFEFAGLTDKKGNVDKKRVGELLNVCPKTVESWIIGRTQPRFEKLIRMREITNISLDWILVEKMPTSKSAPQDHRHDPTVAGIQFFKTDKK